MKTRGELVATALATSWRQTPAAPEFSASDLTSITPLLLESGAGASAWRRIRDSFLAESPAAAELQQAYRLHAIQAALHEIKIKQVFKLFRAAGVESILVKGWAIARLYPEPGLRPYGDIDLCVRPEEYKTAREVLSAAGDCYPVDLHNGIGMLDDREWDEVFARSQLVTLENVEVRVLSAEDHFRVLCFHLLRHGVERASGLCDIAVVLESRPAAFSWDICLGENRRHADWIAVTIGLAGELLGAEIGDTPFAVSDRQPAWLVKCVLKAWGRPFSSHFTQQASLDFYLRHPRGVLQALAARWPTPILGTVGTGGAFNSLPRFPYQLGYLLLRSGRFLKQLSAPNSEPTRFFTARSH
ncbi:MAG: nucleotidyltransferase family protein [Pyrinomonadaceae bacterium]